MRRLAQRPSLSKTTSRKLQSETDLISKHLDPVSESARRYKNAREAKWFAPVVIALRSLSGPGERCMFCSGSECSDLEHYHPKSKFPVLALSWENFLWCCAPCNRRKSSRFPPITETGGQLINPLVEDVWRFFFIDKFGFLTPVYDASTNAQNLRAVSTERILELNREAVQESRKIRFENLVRQVTDSLNLFQIGELTQDCLLERKRLWLIEPFQPDVADYFFNGPGNVKEPFRRFLQAIS